MTNLHPTIAAVIAPFLAPPVRTPEGWAFHRLVYRPDGELYTLWKRVDGQGQAVYQVTKGGPIDGQPTTTAGYQHPFTLLRLKGLSLNAPTL
jgi:hypothetical protein